jgi:hypothetical protein
MVLITGMYSCQSFGGGDKGFIYSIDLDDAETIEQPMLSEFCDEVETIILETMDDALLSWPSKIIHVNDDLYIFNDDPFNPSVGPSILKFGANGKFARRYGTRGRGPGEYLDLVDFTVDKQDGVVYLLDGTTNKIMSYDIESGKFAEDIVLGKVDDPRRSNTIASIGNTMYADILYRQFDKSNYMWKSWNKADPTHINYHLPVDEHLKGWTNTSVRNNNNFVFMDGNESALLSNRFSPEIFKVTEDGLTNYVYIKSKNFVDKKVREKISAVENAYKSPSDPSAFDILNKTNLYYEVSQYFETNNNICFILESERRFWMFIYNKIEGTTRQATPLFLDLLYKNKEVSTLSWSFGSDTNGIYTYVSPGSIDKLRTAAREGMLVDGLDRLDELKELKDGSNGVLFYMKFKDPMR